MVLAVASGVTIVVAPIITGSPDRQVLRDAVVPPVELYDYPSPLMKFRNYVTDREEETLFTVEGLPENARVRLAALDAYSGVVYNVNPAASRSFVPVGDAQSSAGATSAGNGATLAQLTFTIEGYQGVWVPGR